MCHGAELFRDDFSKLPPRIFSEPIKQLTNAIQEYHYLPHRGVPTGPAMRGVVGVCEPVVVALGGLELEAAGRLPTVRISWLAELAPVRDEAASRRPPERRPRAPVRVRSSLRGTCCVVRGCVGTERGRALSPRLAGPEVLERGTVAAATEDDRPRLGLLAVSVPEE